MCGSAGYSSKRDVCQDVKAGKEFYKKKLTAYPCSIVETICRIGLRL
jgi:hypothetical protein